MNTDILKKLEDTISDRKANPKPESYTNRLLESDNKIIKKLGEENAEYIRAFLVCSREELAGEAADYLYHLMVSLAYRDVSLENVLKILEERHS